MHPVISSRQRSGKVLQVILILLACVAALSAAYFLPMLGPTKWVERSDRDLVQERREMEELRTKSQDMWDRFVNLRDFKEKLDPEDIKMLEEALVLREEFVQRTDNKVDPAMIIDEMRTAVQTFQAEEYRNKSRAEEAIGLAAREKEDYAAAATAYARAVELEELIGEKCPLSKRKDYIRLSHLRQQLKYAEAYPVWESSHNLEKEADALAEKKAWATAAEKYREAHAKEELLRSKYQGTFPLEFSRPARLLAKAETVESAPEHEKIQELIARAVTLVQAGNVEEAETQWDAALARSEDLAKLYPRSEYVQSQVIEALRETRDRTLVTPVAAAFARSLATLDQTIRQGRADEAGNLALRLRQEANRILQKYPASNAIDSHTQARLQYLSIKSRDITLVQGRFLALLRPLPGNDKLLMMYSEVPQVLYSAIMDNRNPSAVPGDALPVESVTYDDALAFCQRLSWLTGRTVRLPKEEEFRRALGTVDAAVLATQAWAIENSGGSTHNIATQKPNAHGFFDLLGNVSEWLEAEEFAPAASEIGGNCQTGLAALTTVPLISVPKRDKSRLRGFRVLVDDTAIQ